MRGNGLIGLDRSTVIEAKLDAVMNKLSSNEEEEPYKVEETKCMNEQRSYNFKPNPNFPTHYSLALRNHESFSYGGGAQQGPRH